MSATTTSTRRAEAMPGLKGRGVLVTGGTSGIGQAIAVKFAEYGANVAINYLHQPGEASETEQQVQACVNRVQQEGVRDVLVQGDVSREADVVAMVGQTVSELGGLDVVINNAGIQISRHSDELASDDFDKVLAVNLRGAFLCAREAIRHFLAENKPGVIINVSSVHQLIPKPDYLGYSVSKGGMQNLTRTLALEYAAEGSASTGSAPARPSRRSTARGSMTRSSASRSRATYRWRAPARPRRWVPSRASSLATTPPTSLVRRSSSTAG